MSLAVMLEEVADALRPLADEIPDLQVYAFWEDNPSPPCIDIYPGSPFQDGAGMGAGNNKVYLTVRARVGMGDPMSGQALLIRMLDPADAACVEKALATVDWAVTPDGISGFTQYSDDGPANERMLGCEWRVNNFL
jgi:hypothetical protein